MNKKNIIALSGDLAAGKGTVSEILIKDLNYGEFLKLIYDTDHYEKILK